MVSTQLALFALTSPPPLVPYRFNPGVTKVGGVGKSSNREFSALLAGVSKLFPGRIMGVCVAGGIGECKGSGVLKPEPLGCDLRRGVVVLGGSGSLNSSGLLGFSSLRSKGSINFVNVIGRTGVTSKSTSIKQDRHVGVA